MEEYFKLKNKKIIFMLLIIAIIFLIPTITRGAVTYTRTITGSDGSITINLEGLTLDELKQYEFAILSSSSATPSVWHEITTMSETTATVFLNSSTSDILNVLRVTDTGYLYIREKNTENYIINNFSIDLKLPYLNAVNYDFSYDWYTIGTLYGKIGGGVASTHTYYKVCKVTDENLIERCFHNNQINVAEIEGLLPAPPTTGYTQNGYFTLGDEDEGLYIIWLQLTGVDTKTVYAAIMHAVLPDTTDEPLEDTTRYISFPFIIYNGSSSVSVKNYSGSYSMYYQFVEATYETYQSIEELDADYDADEMTDSEYLKAYDELMKPYNEDNWINTSDGSFSVDLSKFEGTKYFTMWVKLVMGDKTVYEPAIFSMNGTQEKPDEQPDDTEAKGVLPDTGKTIAIWIIGAILSSGIIIGYIKYRKMNKIV